MAQVMMMMDVHKLAVLQETKRLELLSMQYVEASVTVDSVLQALRCSSELKLAGLKDYCFKFIVRESNCKYIVNAECQADTHRPQVVLDKSRGGYRVISCTSNNDGPVILQIRYPPHALQLTGQILIHTCFELINASILQIRYPHALYCSRAKFNFITWAKFNFITCFELINAAFLQVAIVTNATLSLTQTVINSYSNERFISPVLIHDPLANSRSSWALFRFNVRGISTLASPHPPILA